MRETTALGAAIAAGFAAKVWSSFDELRGINDTDRQTFAPSTDDKYRKEAFELWEKAVERARGWS